MLLAALCIALASFGVGEVGVEIVAPAPNALVPTRVAGSASHAGDVLLRVRYSGVRDAASGALNESWALRVRGDGWLEFDFGPPLPPADFYMELRYGTHTLAARLVDARDGREVGAPSEVTFDVVPAPGVGVLTDRALRAGRPAARTARTSAAASRGSAAATAWAPRAVRRAARARPVRVVLVGNLNWGGQSLLALEQARALPRPRRADGGAAFRVTFATGGEAADGPLAARAPRPAPRSRATASTCRARTSTTTATASRPRSRCSRAPTRRAICRPTCSDGAGSRRARAPSVRAPLGDEAEAARSSPSPPQGSPSRSRCSRARHRELQQPRALPPQRRAARRGRAARRRARVLCEPSNLWWGAPPTVSRGVRAARAVGLRRALLAARARRRARAVRRPAGRRRGRGGRRFRRGRGRARAGAGGARARAARRRDEVVVALLSRLVPQKAPACSCASPPRSRRSTARTARCARASSCSATGRCGRRSARMGRRSGCACAATGERRAGEPDDDDDDAWDIEFAGELPHAAVAPTLRARVDVVVHPNLLEETFCIANLEAMHARRRRHVGVGGVDEYLRRAPPPPPPPHADAAEQPAERPRLRGGRGGGRRRPRPRDRRRGGRRGDRARRGGARGARSRRRRGRARVRSPFDFSLARMTRQYASLYSHLACEGAESDATRAGLRDALVALECDAAAASPRGAAPPPDDVGALIGAARCARACARSRAPAARSARSRRAPATRRRRRRRSCRSRWSTAPARRSSSSRASSTARALARGSPAAARLALGARSSRPRSALARSEPARAPRRAGLRAARGRGVYRRDRALRARRVSAARALLAAGRAAQRRRRGRRARARGRCAAAARPTTAR